jgi:hypothetical protein
MPARSASPTTNAVVVPAEAVGGQEAAGLERWNAAMGKYIHCFTRMGFSS